GERDADTLGGQEARQPLDVPEDTIHAGLDHFENVHHFTDLSTAMRSRIRLSIIEREQLRGQSTGLDNARQRLALEANFGAAEVKRTKCAAEDKTGLLAMLRL